jgi:ABC-type spermidine/putrescine transport system permease subunit I
MNGAKAELANIGPKEIRKRLLMGVAMLALGVVVAVVLAHADVSRGWYAALFLPFWIGALALSQARKKT